MLFTIAKQKYGLSFDNPEIYFKDSGESSISSLFNVNYLRLSILDPYTAGIVFSYASNNSIPTWLCVGIELFWLEQYGLLEKTEDVDINLFLSKLDDNALPVDINSLYIADIDNILITDIFNITKQFVQKLEIENKLHSLLESYINHNYCYDLGLTDEWERIFSDEFNNSFVYMRNFRSTAELMEVHTKQAVYTFYDEDWDLNNIKNYVEYMEKGILFVKNWFDYDSEEQFIIQIYKTSDTLLGIRSGYFDRVDKTITIYDFLEEGTSTTIHEIVHAVSERMGFYSGVYSGGVYSGTIFVPFFQGIAELLKYLHDEEVQGYLSQKVKQALNQCLDNPESTNEFQMQFFDCYNNRIGADFKQNDDISSVALLDVYAMLTYSDEYPDYTLWGEIENHGIYTYIQAASFVQYLINEYGKENFFMVYKDFYTFDDVYNVPIQEIIVMWKEYLGVVAE